MSFLVLRLEVYFPLELYLNNITALYKIRKVLLDSPPESVNESLLMFFVVILEQFTTFGFFSSASISG